MKDTQMTHPYDNVFRMLFDQLSDRVIIGFINKIFNRNYPINTELRRNQSDIVSMNGDRLNRDKVFAIGGRQYHIEAQSEYDKRMTVRMLEYGVQSAIANMEWNEDNPIFRLPNPAVLYLDPSINKREPMKIDVRSCDDEHIMYYSVKECFLSEYKTLDEFIEAGLYPALPFYMLFTVKENESAENYIRRFNDVMNVYKNDEENHSVFTQAIKDVAENIVQPKMNFSEEDFDMLRGHEAMKAAYAKHDERLIQEGIQKGRQEPILAMLANGCDFGFISNLTNIPYEEVEKIYEENKDTINAALNSAKNENTEGMEQ